MNTTKSPSAFGAIVIAIGIAFSGYLLANGLKVMKTSDRYVTVKGLVERIEKADFANTKIGFKVAGNDLITLYNELESISTRVESFLDKAGYAKSEISRDSPNVTDTHIREWGPEKLPEQRYILSGSVDIKTDNVDLSFQLSSMIGELVSQGVNLSEFNTWYHLKKFNDLRPEMLAEAIQNAKEMGDQFALNSGSKLGGIRKANQGVMSISAADSAPGDEYNRGDNSLMKKIRVVSTFDFYIKN